MALFVTLVLPRQNRTSGLPGKSEFSPVVAPHSGPRIAKPHISDIYNLRPDDRRRPPLMKMISRLFAFGFFVFSSSAPGFSAPDVKAELAKILDLQQEAWNRRDIDGFMA